MEKDNNNYIWLYHRYRSVKTIKDFMDREKIYNITPDEFFQLNKELIWQQYSDIDKSIEAAAREKRGMSKEEAWPKSVDDIDINSWLPCPCNLKIQATKVTAEMAISQTNFQVNSGDFYSFASEEISKILQNEGYQIDHAQRKNPQVQVFGWFKSLYYVGLSAFDNKKISESKTISEFADLSKYIISLSTLVTKEGGSFSLRLPILNASGLIKVLTEKGTENHVAQQGIASKDQYHSFYRYGKEYYAKNEYNILESNYYNWLISSNDLIFISFEKLEMEKSRTDINKGVGDEDNFDIQSNIANNVYDMIGIVDDVKVVSDSPSSTAYVEVTGRDFMKLLIEDGSFFFNPSTTSNPSEVFKNEASFGKQGDIKEADQINNTYNNPIGRLRRVTGEIDIFANRINMDLSYILKGVISQLANVEIVPGYVFDSWGRERTTYNELQPIKKDK